MGAVSEEISSLAVQVLESGLDPAVKEEVRVQRVQQLEAMRGLVTDATELAQSVDRIVSSTVDLMRLSIVVEAELTRLTIETTAKRERLAILAPPAVKLLRELGASVDDLVKRACSIDPRTCTDAEIRWRNRLMDLAQKQSDALNEGLMRLLS